MNLSSPHQEAVIRNESTQWKTPECTLTQAVVLWCVDHPPQQQARHGPCPPFRSRLSTSSFSMLCSSRRLCDAPFLPDSSTMDAGRSARRTFLFPRATLHGNECLQPTAMKESVSPTDTFRFRPERDDDDDGDNSLRTPGEGYIVADVAASGDDEMSRQQVSDALFACFGNGQLPFLDYDNVSDEKFLGTPKLRMQSTHETLCQLKQFASFM